MKGGRPFVSVPLWRLTGDHYLDAVPRLNDWDGVEKAPRKPRVSHILLQGDTSCSQGDMKSDPTYSLKRQCHQNFGAVFSYR